MCIRDSYRLLHGDSSSYMFLSQLLNERFLDNLTPSFTEAQAQAWLGQFPASIFINDGLLDIQSDLATGLVNKILFLCLNFFCERLCAAFFLKIWQL